MTTQHARRAATVALRVALIAAIGLTLFVAYGLIDNAWYRVLAVRGGSMEPTITAGDLVVITRPPTTIEAGQVLTFQVDGSVVTHRVMAVNADGSFTTQGDANEARDDWSANEVHIVGEYRFSLPLIGVVVDAVATAAWFTDVDDSASSAESGAWDDETEARSVDEANDEITGRDAPAEEPSPSAPSPTDEPAPSVTPEPSAEPSSTVEPTPTP